MAGIYVHIPFCASFCTYCGFYSEICSRNASHSRFVDSLRREMQLRRDFFNTDEPIKTVYFGGGTPSLLSPEEFASIYDALTASFDLSKAEEFTVEVNPEDVASDHGLLAAFRHAGVNRISMGVQSFCDSHLR